MGSASSSIQELISNMTDTFQEHPHLEDDEQEQPQLPQEPKSRKQRKRQRDKTSRRAREKERERRQAEEGSMVVAESSEQDDAHSFSHSEEGSGEEYYSAESGARSVGGELDQEKVQQERQRNHGDPIESPIISGEKNSDPVASAPEISVESHATQLSVDSHAPENSAESHVTQDHGLTTMHHADQAGTPRLAIQSEQDSGEADASEHASVPKRRQSLLAIVAAKALPAIDMASIQAESGEETARTVRMLAAQVSDLTAQVAELTARLSTQTASPHNVRSPDTAGAAAGQAPPYSIIVDLESESAQKADKTVGQLLYARRPECGWWVTLELQTKLTEFSLAVHTQDLHYRFDADMKLIIRRAILRADHLWSAAPPLPRHGKIVPESTALGEALRSDTVALRADKMGGFGFQAPAPAPLGIQSATVERELFQFLALSTIWGVHTHFAKLAYHLWADEAVHRILTPDNFRQRLYWAFPDTTLYHYFNNFQHIRPHDNLEPTEPHQSAALQIWSSSFSDK